MYDSLRLISAPTFCKAFRRECSTRRRCLTRKELSFSQASPWQKPTIFASTSPNSLIRGTQHSQHRPNVLTIIKGAITSHSHGRHRLYLSLFLWLSFLPKHSFAFIYSRVPQHENDRFRFRRFQVLSLNKASSMASNFTKQLSFLWYKGLQGCTTRIQSSCISWLYSVRVHLERPLPPRAFQNSQISAAEHTASIRPLFCIRSVFPLNIRNN